MDIDRIKNKIKELRSKKGFTLIELIVVIAVLGILVLMAAPKFLGYTSEAKMVQVKNDIKAHETQLIAKLMKDDTITNDWAPVDPTQIDSMKDSIYNTKGKVAEDYNFNGELLVIDKSDIGEVKSKLNGTFLYNTSNDEILYYEENLNIGQNTDGNNVENGNSNGNQIDPSNPSDQNAIPEVYTLTGEDLNFVDYEYGKYEVNGQNGYFTIDNTIESPTVIIPDTVEYNGETVYLDDYSFMFSTVNPAVEKVKSTNADVESMNSMFAGSSIVKMDVSELETFSVWDVENMFEDTANLLEVKFGTFGNENLESLEFMFYNVNPNIQLIDMSEMITADSVQTTQIFANDSGVFNAVVKLNDALKSQQSSLEYMYSDATFE